MDQNKIIKDVLESFPGSSRDNLIPMLQMLQDEIGYLPEETIKKLGENLKLPASKIFGLATFYNQFRFTPPGKYHIQVCGGTACHLEGSGVLLNEIKKQLGIEDGETTRDGIFSLEVLSCIGACGQAPVIAVNGEYFDLVEKKKLKIILQNIREKEETR